MTSWVANPNRHFTNPIEVLQARDLNNDEKRRILESWKLDAQRLADSTAENMSGGEKTDLREVSNSLLELKAMTEAPSVAAPKPLKAGAQARLPLAIGVGAVVGAGLGLAIIVAYPGVTASPVIIETSVIGALAGAAAAIINAAMRK